MLVISHLQVSREDTPILKGLHLTVNPGTVHALMGQNGSGKSTLAATIMGHPYYQVTAGEISFKGQIINDLSPDKRAKLGLFLAFQHPLEIPGVSVASCIKEALQAVTGISQTVQQFNEALHACMDRLGLDRSYAERALNSAFSGGEKKRLELLQLYMLKPELIILDEIDSGLDIDALRLVASNIVQLKEENPAMCVIIITHYQRILDYIIPDYVHIMRDGVIARSGTAELVSKLEAQGYDGVC